MGYNVIEHIEVVDNSTGKVIFTLKTDLTDESGAVYTLDDESGMTRKVSVYKIPPKYYSVHEPDG